MPLVSLDRVSLAFGHLPLLETVSLQIDAGERVAVIGRNGAGKSTLLQVVGGSRSPDAGIVWIQPGVRTARLEQDVPLSTDRAVFDVVAEGLGDLQELLTDYHHAAVAVADVPTESALATLGRLQHDLEERDGWRFEQRIELVLSQLRLGADTIVDSLSGGWRRRVLLARALVSQPDVLLLDEPTNHLDVDAIGWLETFLAEYQGAVLFVTHDRAFLQRLATRIVELDRGRLTSWPGDYQTFLTKKEEWLANEAIQEAKFDKRLALEEAWLRQGIKARRTRNEGRVRALEAMRAERAQRRHRPGTAQFDIERAESSGKLVVEARGVTKSLGGRIIVNDLSTRIARGDRVGVIGPNGVGKTTLLRLLLGEMPPDSGEVRLGAGVKIAYYDQQREQLDPDRTVLDTVGDGNDTITVDGRSRHVHGYLQDFLFPAERARSPVRSLSGGERNRLLLARLFTRPANLLVLDEPTNDLDLETLELLEQRLVEWSGTLILVSHDRAFLDNVVTSTMSFEPDGHVSEYVGGYEDWLRQRQAAQRNAQDEGSASSPAPHAIPVRRPVKTAGALSSAKLSYRERRELEVLPGSIDTLEQEERLLNAHIASPDFYREMPGRIHEVLSRLEAVHAELAAMYARWDLLDSRPK